MRASKQADTRSRWQARPPRQQAGGLLISMAGAWHVAGARAALQRLCKIARCAFWGVWDSGLGIGGRAADVAPLLAPAAPPCPTVHHPDACHPRRPTSWRRAAWWTTTRARRRTLRSARPRGPSSTSAQTRCALGEGCPSDQGVGEGCKPRPEAPRAQTRCGGPSGGWPCWSSAPRGRKAGGWFAARHGACEGAWGRRAGRGSVYGVLGTVWCRCCRRPSLGPPAAGPCPKGPDATRRCMRFRRV